MAKVRKNFSALVVWSIPLLLMLLVLSLVGSATRHVESTVSRNWLPPTTQPQASIVSQSSLAGTLDLTNPQQMVPVPHPGRWYLRTSNSASAQLVCAHFRYPISNVFVEGLTAHCQVVLIALHLPLTTYWQLDAA